MRLVGLYSVTDVYDSLLPLTMSLVNDRVAQVRLVGFRVVGGTLFAQ